MSQIEQNVVSYGCAYVRVWVFEQRGIVCVSLSLSFSLHHFALFLSLRTFNSDRSIHTFVCENMCGAHDVANRCDCGRHATTTTPTSTKQQEQRNVPALEVGEALVQLIRPSAVHEAIESELLAAVRATLIPRDPVRDKCVCAKMRTLSDDCAPYIHTHTQHTHTHATHTCTLKTRENTCDRC